MEINKKRTMTFARRATLITKLEGITNENLVKLHFLLNFYTEPGEWWEKKKKNKWMNESRREIKPKFYKS